MFDVWSCVQCSCLLDNFFKFSNWPDLANPYLWLVDFLDLLYWMKSSHVTSEHIVNICNIMLLPSEKSVTLNTIWIIEWAIADPNLKSLLFDIKISLLKSFNIIFCFSGLFLLMGYFWTLDLEPLPFIYLYGILLNYSNGFF